ncbi:phospholipase D-like domain-containing protein [Shinella pollutisoli]|uniref:Phospholipase D n=1 Tax=Shinella pollutisoli TaxID=2250594 RepID=A0ABV7DLZ5_9HYPH
MKNEGSWPHAPDGGAYLSIVRPGRNAWRVANADRVGFLVDGQAYFRALEAAFAEARREIWIVGWDFNPDIRLRPEDPASPTLGETLLRLVQSRPELTIRVLIWAMGPVYSGKSLAMFRKRYWSSHPRILLAFDSGHPLRASHHQKFVVVDDRVAFVGGIDLTAKRWDTSDHAADDPRRTKPSGRSYGPVHDVQLALEGEAARLVGAVGRHRWALATGVDVPACDTPGTVGLNEADLAQSHVAFARTEPAFRGREGASEAIELTLSALNAARRHIYIETQYFASQRVCRLLCERLAEPNGPEVVVVTTLSAHGTIERLVLGANRDRFLRRLARADRHGRLRAFYPVVPTADGGEREINVHSKLIVVDDAFVRIGSANLNHRSEGLDTELDAAIEARRPQERQAIRRLRDRLLAEHLGTVPDSFTAAVNAEGSLVAAVDALNGGARGLRPFPEAAGKGAVEAVPGTGIVDPVAPWWPLPAWAEAAAALLRAPFAAIPTPASRQAGDRGRR